MRGQTDSFGAGGGDFWILKLDNAGNVIWQKTYGGPNFEIPPSSIQQTMDGGYIVAGGTFSFGDGGSDMLILKLDADGNIPGCSLGEPSNAQISNTTVTGVNSSATVNNTNATITTPSVSVADTSVAPNYICEAVVSVEVDQGGGTVSLPDDSASVFFPPDAIPDEVFVSIVEVEETSVPPPSGGFELLGSVYDFSAEADGVPVTEFDDFLQITLQFNPSDLNGLDPVIQYYEGENWVALLPPAQIVDYDNNTVTAFTDHFTLFGIFGIPEPSTFVLFGIGLFGLSAFAWRKRRQKK